MDGILSNMNINEASSDELSLYKSYQEQQGQEQPQQQEQETKEHQSEEDITLAEAGIGNDDLIETSNTISETQTEINSLIYDIKEQNSELSDSDIYHVLGESIDPDNPNLPSNIELIQGVSQEDLDKYSGLNPNITNLGQIPISIQNLGMSFDFKLNIEFDINNLTIFSNLKILKNNIKIIFNNLLNINGNSIKIAIDRKKQELQQIASNVENSTMGQTVSGIASTSSTIVNEITKDVNIVKNTISNPDSYIMNIFKYKITRYLVNFTCMLLLVLTILSRFFLDNKLDNSSIILIGSGFIIIGLIIYYNFFETKLLDIYDMETNDYIKDDKEKINSNFSEYIMKLLIALLLSIIIFKEYYTFLYTLHMTVNTIVFTSVSVFNIIYTWIRMLIDEFITIPTATYNFGKKIINMLFENEVIEGSVMEPIDEALDVIPIAPIKQPIKVVVKNTLITLMNIAMQIITSGITVPVTVISKSSKIIEYTIIYAIILFILIFSAIINIGKRITLVTIFSIARLFTNEKKLINIRSYIDKVYTKGALDDLKTIDFKQYEHDLFSIEIEDMRLNDIKFTNTVINLINEKIIGTSNRLFDYMIKTGRKKIPLKMNIQQINGKVKDVQELIQDNIEFSIDDCAKYLDDYSKAVEGLLNIYQEMFRFPEFFAISDKNKNFNALLYSSEIIEYLKFNNLSSKVNLSLVNIIIYIVMIIIHSLVIILLFIRIIISNKNKIKKYDKENLYFYHNSILVLYVISYILIYLILMSYIYKSVKGDIEYTDLDSLINSEELEKMKLRMKKRIDILDDANRNRVSRLDMIGKHYDTNYYKLNPHIITSTLPDKLVEKMKELKDSQVEEKMKKYAENMKKKWTKKDE